MDSENGNRDLIVRLAGMLAPPLGEVIRPAGGYTPEADRPATLAKALPSRRDWSALRRLLWRKPTTTEWRTFTAAWKAQLDSYVRRRASGGATAPGNDVAPLDGRSSDGPDHGQHTGSGSSSRPMVGVQLPEGLG